MSLTSTSFTTTFDLTTTPQKRFRFHDTTNYAAQGITLSWVKNVLTIIGPGGVTFYSNNNYSTPNINPSVSLNDLILIPLQLDAGGNVVQGDYTVIMTSQVDDGVNPVYYFEHSQDFTYEYTSPTVSINQSVNCVSPLFTSTDETVYTVNNVIPTITRDHSVYFPIGSGLTNLTGSTAQTITLSSNQFANGTQTTEITTSLSYNFGNNLYVTDSVTGVLEIQVNCEWVCKITCCLKALNNRMESQRCSNYPAFLQTKDIFTQVMSKVTLIMQLISCGQEADVSSIITQIQELANCTDDCCGKDTPSLVGGLNGGTSAAISVVQSGGSPVTVTDVTVGDTTTYTITLDPAFITTVSNSYNTVLANGGGITWTDSGVVAGVRTFTPSLSVAGQNMMAFKVNMVFSMAHTGFATITVLNPQISGSTFQAPTVSTLQVSPQIIDFNCFVVNNFFVGTPNNNYKVYATMEIKDSNPTSGLSFEEIQPGFLFDYTGGPQSSGSFMFRLDNKTALNPTAYEDLGGISFDTTINFLIIA